MEELKKYDSNNNLIYRKVSTGFGFEEWFEYDSNGYITHYKDSDGFEYWQEFNSNNILIHYKDSNGLEEWYATSQKNSFVI